MSLSKRITLTLFLSVVMFAICVSSTSIKDQHLSGSDMYGWPDIFFKVVYKDFEIKDMNFEFDRLAYDFSLWLGLNTSIMIIIRLMKVNRDKRKGSIPESGI